LKANDVDLFTFLSAYTGSVQTSSPELKVRETVKAIKFKEPSEFQYKHRAEAQNPISTNSVYYLGGTTSMSHPVTSC
jgi:hypothetical protein